MSPHEILNTMLALLAAFAAGASIAVMGNRVGRRTGRDKWTLFGLRPRHTATLVTGFTGGTIATITLLVSLALSGQMAVLQGRYGDLQLRMEALTGQYASTLRRGHLVIPARSVLAMEPVEPGLSEPRRRALLDSVLGHAEARVRQAFYQALADLPGTPAEPEGSLLVFEPRQVRSTLDALQDARTPQAIEVQVPENAWLEGDRMSPVPVLLQAVSVFRVYRAGDLVARLRIDPQDPDLLGRLMVFVYEEVPAAARAAHMPVNPVSARIEVRVGSSPALDWSSRLFRALESASGEVELQALASRETFSLGRLDLVLVVPDLQIRIPEPPPAPGRNPR